MPPLDRTYVAKTDDRSGHICGYLMGGGRAYCSCKGFQQTGKRCAGLWALETLNLAGRVAEYEKDVMVESSLLTRVMRAEVSATIDETELINCWNDNILEDPRAYLINTGLDTPAEPISDELHEVLRDVTPVSPIGRRSRVQHDSVAKDDQAGEPEDSGIHRINTNGRPAHTRPLQPRRKPQKSSLARSRDDSDRLGAPTGFNNTGTDCFALSLFQLLARQNAWRCVFDSGASRAAEGSPVVQLLQRFQEYMDVGEVATFAELRDVLRGVFSLVISRLTKSTTGANLIGDQASGQHDPTETLAKMIDHFDTLSSSFAHRDVFVTVTERNQQCPMGHEHGYQHCPDGEPVLYAYTETLAGRPNPSTITLLQTALLYPPMRKPCPECGLSATVDTAAKFVRLGKLLAIHVAWNVDRTSFDQESRPTKVACQYFDISLTVDLSVLYRKHKDGSQTKVTGSLCGLLCKQGSRIDVGHYVAYIQHNDRWWRMDDHRAIDVRSISDAFDDGRYPVFLLYRTQEMAPKGLLVSSELGPEPTTSRTKKTDLCPKQTIPCLRATNPRPEPTKRPSTKDRTSSIGTDPQFLLEPIVPEPTAVMFKYPAELSSLHDEVMQRYGTVTWANDSRKSVIDTIARPEDITTTLGRAVIAMKAKTSAILPGTTEAIIREYVPKYVRRPKTWWHSDMIHVILEAVDSHTNRGLRGHLALLHLNFEPNGAPYCAPEGEDHTGRRRPWLCLPRNWLSTITTGVISSSNNTHFVAIAIFGPQKLVVVYDGEEGIYDAPGLWEVRIQSLGNSLQS